MSGAHRSRRAADDRRGRVRLALVVLALSLATASCAAFEDGNAADTRDDVERENRAEGDVEGGIGDELDVYDLAVSVTEVRRVAAFSEIDNRGYIVADVTMTNDTGRSLDFDRTDWRIEKPDGTVANTSNVSTEPQLQDDTVPPGGTVEGQVIFAVGDQEGQFAVLFVSASMRPDDELEVERGVWVFDSAPGDAE